MDSIFQPLESAPLWIAILFMGGAFLALGRCANEFVTQSVAIAEFFGIPKLIIGIVLVSLATTVPETAVSVQSSLAGNSQFAMGNAIGSIACNTGLALAFCGVLSARPIPVIPRVLRVTGGSLLLAILLAFAFVAGNHTLSRWQGATLIAVLFVYLGWIISQRHPSAPELDRASEITAPYTPPAQKRHRTLWQPLPRFILALAGIIVAARLTLASAIGIATALHVPNTVIALTLVALGTSIPEVATSISAARRGHGEMAIGTILGANILNICWVIGLTAVVRPLTLSGREIAFMFPAALALTVISLAVLASHGALSRKEGLLLFGCYLIYLAGLPLIF